MYTAIFYAQLLFIRQKKQRKFTGAKVVHNKLVTVCTAVAFSCQGERIFSTIFPKSEKAKRKKTREQILDTETIEYRYFSLFIFISCYIIYSFSKILLWPTLNDKMFSTICCHNGVRVLDKKLLMLFVFLQRIWVWNRARIVHDQLILESWNPQSPTMSEMRVSLAKP